MALLLAQARNVPQANADLRAGPAGTARSGKASSCTARRSGIVGLGRVGVLVAQRAHAFGMRLVAYDPFVSPDRARQLGVQLADTMDELVAVSDFVTIHATKTPDTIGLVNAEVLTHAKPGHAARSTPGRGGIVDEDALADAIRDGRLGGAAIDTFAKEPTTESPLFELDNVVVTPHLGASTAEAQDKAGETIAEQVVLALARRLRAVRGQRRRVGGVRGRAPVPAARRAARPAVLGARRRRAGDARGVLRGRDRRLRLPGAHAVDPQGRARPGRRRAGERS